LSQDDNNIAEQKRFFLPDFCHVQSVFFVVLVAEMLALLLSLARFDSYNFWYILGRYSLFIQWIALLSAGLLCASRPRLKKLTDTQAGLTSYCLVLLVTLSASMLAQWLESGLDASVHETAWDWNAISYSLFVSAILSAFWLRLFYLQSQHLVRLEAEADAKLQALQARIKPHFLFNSMNILSSLISIDPKLAEEVVEDLSELFRASLSEHKNLVSLDQEVDICRKYLHIEKLRLGSRLQMDWNIKVSLENYKIPPLTLQPLIENAVYHGIQPLVDGGEVTVTIGLAEEKLHITITNPLGSEARDKTEGNQVAVENISHRLALIFGSDATLKYRVDGNQYVVDLFIPSEGL